MPERPTREMILSGASRRAIAAVLMVTCLAVILAGGCGVPSGQVGDASVSSSTQESGSEMSAKAASNGTLMLGVMVHLEGWKSETRNRTAFEQHASLVRQYADIFEKCGLRLTLEASPEFTQGCARWGDNVLKEMAERGHAVGLHADLGAEPGLTQQEFAAGLSRMKGDIESLGVPVRHVSGICSSLDWVKAAEDAGFEFVTGTVEYALKSIPADRLPAEYKDVLTARTPLEGHGNVPHELADRLHPWRMASGADWLWNNPEGNVVIIPGDGGTCIPWMAEAAGGSATGPRTAFTVDDVAAFTRELDKALGCADPDKINALYVGWSIGQQVDPAVVEAWAQAIRTYIDSGKAQWNSLTEMYDAYVDWETAR